MRTARAPVPLPRIDHGDVQTPLCTQLREGIRRQILDGELKPGEALVPVRRLCKELGVNRVTADQAIRELVAEGLLRSEHGRGVFVNDLSPLRVALVINRLAGNPKDDRGSGYLAMLRAAQEALQRKNVRTVTVCRREGGEREKFGPRLEEVLAVQADALMPIGIQNEAYLAALVADGRPVVALDAAPLNSSFDGIVLDTFRTGYLAARHLLELGHRRILFVGYDRGVHPFDPQARIPEPDSERMAAGFVYALKEAAVPREATKLYEFYPREGELRAALEGDLSSGRYTAAILVHTHAESLKAAGALPPGLDVVVTEAAQDAPNAAQWTRVELDEADFGRWGARRMLQRLNEARTPGRRPSSGSLTTIEPVLVKGPSTHRIGPPPALYAYPREQGTPPMQEKHR